MGLLKSMKKGTSGTHLFWVHEHPWRLMRSGEYVWKLKLCAALVISGPSAEGVPGPMLTEMEASAGSDSVATNASQRLSPALSAIFFAALSAWSSSSVASLTWAPRPSAETWTVSSTAWGSMR